MKNQLQEIKAYLEEIGSNWNGDDSGLAEDKTIASNEGLELVEKLEAILEELE